MLSITTQPSSTETTGQPLSTQPVVQLVDSQGTPLHQSGVPVTVGIASGNGTLSGTLTINTDSNGVATFTDLSISGSGTQTLGFSAPGFSISVSAASATSNIITVGSGGGGFQTPDVFNNIDFETDLHPLTDYADNYPPQCIRDTTKAYHGIASIKVPISPNQNDSGQQSLLLLPRNYGRLWFQWYFNITGKMNTTHKYLRCYDTGFNNGCGGVWVVDGQPGFSLCFDAENDSVQFPAGPSDSIFDGNWHRAQLDFQRNGVAPDGSSWPNMALWVDGVQVTHADGSIPGGTAYWKNNRLYSGQRVISTGIGRVQLMAVVNGGNTAPAYQENMDYISISSLGPIGP